MTLHRLKVAALQHEQREDWAGAIELYRQAIREAEGGAEGGDPSIFNRIGDLALKAGDATAACEAWEQAVARYADLGLINSAIALCNKILRVKPDRIQTYLELARLHARKRVLYDVRVNLQVYLDQTRALGQHAAGRTAVERLSQDFPGWPELESLLDTLLDREPASAPKPAESDTGDGKRNNLVFLDTELTIERASEPPVIGESESGDSAPSVVADLEFEPRSDDIPVAGFEPTRTETAPSEPPTGTLDGLIGVAQTSRELEPTEVVEGLDQPAGVTAEEAQPSDHMSDADIGGDLVFLDTAPIAPDDALGQRIGAQQLLDRGDRAGGIARLEQALAVYQEQGELLHAFEVAGELVAADPGNVNRAQARVELASRMRDQQRLCDAYVDLGEAFQQQGSEEKAIAVFRRALELDEHHARARAALRAMAPEPEASAAESGFIDLGAMLIDDHPTSTRMRTEMPEVAEDEQDTFREALAEFRRAIDQNLPVEDHQAHYDLGIAFKEMGLLDEAVTEFQKALRAPEVRLRTSEALGEVFFDQKKPAVAEAVLRGAEGGDEGDAEKIGVLYWLGRALDAQSRHKDAVRYYQRVIAVDVNFRDASGRLAGKVKDA